MYGIVRTLSRMAKWKSRALKKVKSNRSLSFYERYVRDTGVKINMKFANDIDQKLSKARWRCLEEANKTIRVQKAMSK